MDKKKLKAKFAEMRAQIQQEHDAAGEQVHYWQVAQLEAKGALKALAAMEAMLMPVEPAVNPPAEAPTE